MDNIKVITSEEEILDLYTHFKVIAGPGAGKTHWLVKHIQNVLKNANNITSTSKVACITYTAVAGEEIQKRLGSSQNKVEVSTIHSFLYTNIVKPYVYLLKDDEGNALVDVKRLDGHDENVATSGKIRTWQKAVGNTYIKDQKGIKKCLENLDWKVETESIYLRSRKTYLNKIGRYSVKNEDLIFYKLLCWKEGVIHHEDVLYFAHRIIEEYPMLLENLSSKYPYIFLDEFQDTSPIQTILIKKLGSAGSIIGVIGDPAQSIYKFQGASRQEFISFSLVQQTLYSIEKNRRCGSKIVNFLNHVRNDDDLLQTPMQGASEIAVYFYEYGDAVDPVFKFQELREKLGLQKDHCVLARSNDIVKKLRSSEMRDGWLEFEEADNDRERFIKKVLSSYKLAKDGRHEVAIKEVIKAFKTDKGGLLKVPFQNDQYINSIAKRSLSVDLIEFLGSLNESFFEDSLHQFYTKLYTFLSAKNYMLKKISRGKIKDFSESISIRSLLDNLVLPEERSAEIRTIHKAKGMEFESVLVYLSNIDEVKRLINPEINSEEDDARILYVGLSRAEKLLCIACPSLENEMRSKLSSMNLIPY